MKKIRVLIIEDSAVVRQFLKNIIENDPRLEVAAVAGSAEEALALLPRLRVDVISLDIRLPGMDGFQATRRIMSEKPTPIVVVSGSVEKEDLKISMNALKAGALTILEKPTGATHADYQAMAERLCTQLAIMSQVKVIRQRPSPSSKVPAAHSSSPLPTQSAYRYLAVVASTGGPKALVELFTRLTPAFPLPVLLVQHINAPFLEGFATWLGSVTSFSVTLAAEGELPQPGHTYMAPADRHLALALGRLHMTREAPVCAQRPSGTVLFQSLAAEAGPETIGVLLTGMGTDGAEGLLRLREAGAHTIAEDASTAVVFGMPKEAERLGAACDMLPLDGIGDRILSLLKGGNS